MFWWIALAVLVVVVGFVWSRRRRSGLHGVDDSQVNRTRHIDEGREYYGGGM